MNDKQRAAMQAAQKFDPSGRIQQRAELVALITDYLREGELIEGGIFAMRGRAIGLLWTTNERLIYAGLVELPIVRLPSFSEYPYAQISSIETSVKKSVLHVLAIKLDKEVTEYTVMPGMARIDDFITLVREKIFTLPQVPSNSQSNDLVSQLERLARLRNQGMLTEEEYAAAKAKLLGV